MAAIIGRRLSCPILRNGKQFLRGFLYRTLMSDSDLKLEGYIRERIFLTDKLNYTGERASLMSKLKEVKTPKDAKNVAFSIADLLHVAENEEELSELERLFTLISMNVITDLESVNFGASLLRLYHHLGLPDRAYELYKNPVCRKLLSDNTCHKVLMDMLYDHGRYELVLDVYSGVQSFNIDCVTLALAAQYQINTCSSFEDSQKLIRSLMPQYSLSRRAFLYAAMLAINQGQPDVALEMLRKCRASNLTFNLTLMCYSELGQIVEVFRHLQEAIESAKDITQPLSVRVYSDTMSMVKQAFARCDNQNHVFKLEQLNQDLSSMGILSQQKASILLDKTIFREHSSMKQSGKKKVIRAGQ